MQDDWFEDGKIGSPDARLADLNATDARRSLFNSGINVSRSLASSSASVSRVMASALGAALSASAGLQPASLLSPDTIEV